MTSWYSFTEAINNTPTNRNILLVRLTNDPIAVQYGPISVDQVDSYTIVVNFSSIITNPDDTTLIQKIINIIFNEDTPDKLNIRRTVSNTSPSVLNDYYSNFVIGCGWINSTLNKRYECIDNTIGVAVWREIPYMLDYGLGTGITGATGMTGTPYDGAVLQYDNINKLWVPQPARYQSIGVNNLIPSQANPPVLLSGEYFFSNGALQQIYGNILIPNDYLENSDIIFNIGYETTNAGTGTVNWNVNYTWANVNDTFPSLTTISSISNTNSLLNQHIRASFPPILGAGGNILSVLKFNIVRTADSYPADVGLLYINISYTANGTGSTQAYIK